MSSPRLLLIIAFIGFISLGLPDAVIGVAWPSVRDHFTLGQGSVGAVFIGAGIGYFFSSSFTGRLLGMMSIGILLAGSSALVAVSAFGYALSAFWWTFVACSLLHGLGSGAIDAGLNSYGAHHFSAKHMNWLHACYSIGATLGPLLMTTVLVRSGSWRLGYATIGIALLMLASLFLATRRQWDGSAGSEPHVTGSDGGMMSALAHPTARLQIIMFFFYTGLEVAVGQWSFTVLTESRAMPTAAAGLWVTAYWGSIAFGRVLFGFVVDALGLDRLLRGVMILAVVGVVLFALPGLGLLSLVGLVLIGIALAPVYPCLMSRTPQRLGRGVAAHAIGFQVAAAMIGAALLPAGCGILAARVSLESVPLAALAMAAILFVLHEMLLRKPDGEARA
jgi:fucose permease